MPRAAVLPLSEVLITGFLPMPSFTLHKPQWLIYCWAQYVKNSSQISGTARWSFEGLCNRLLRCQYSLLLNRGVDTFFGLGPRVLRHTLVMTGSSAQMLFPSIWGKQEQTGRALYKHLPDLLSMQSRFFFQGWASLWPYDPNLVKLHQISTWKRHISVHLAILWLQNIQKTLNISAKRLLLWGTKSLYIYSHFEQVLS